MTCSTWRTTRLAETWTTKSDKSAIITAAAKADQAFSFLAEFSGYDSEAEEAGHEAAALQAYA